jgi:hypothetical protein
VACSYGAVECDGAWMWRVLPVAAAAFDVSAHVLSFWYTKHRKNTCCFTRRFTHQQYSPCTWQLAKQGSTGGHLFGDRAVFMLINICVQRKDLHEPVRHAATSHTHKCTNSIAPQCAEERLACANTARRHISYTCTKSVTATAKSAASSELGPQQVAIVLPVACAACITSKTVAS